MPILEFPPCAMQEAADRFYNVGVAREWKDKALVMFQVATPQQDSEALYWQSVEADIQHDEALDDYRYARAMLDLLMPVLRWRQIG